MKLKPSRFQSTVRCLAAVLPMVGFAANVARAADPAADPAAGAEFFEKRVRPVLVNHCYNCHSADTNAKGGLRVDDRNGLLAGGNTGPAVVPGEPDKSLLIKAVSHADAKLQMPPKEQLSPEQLADLTQWVRDGAAWPQGAPASPALPAATAERYEKLRAGHWAWQPLRDVQAPAVADGTWASDDVDRFVLAKLDEKGLKPVADATKRDLIRRASFDLTGLPPSPEEVDAFEQDASADAFAKVVDRLLASPAFGERWGRHWLDVARYAESTGSSRNIPFPHAWRYRDYVIDAFNKDKPFDQFVREQVAGDLLPAATTEQRDEQRIATGFLALGVKDVNQRFKVRFVMDNVDEQIDTVSRAVLGLTASCARCHDHKTDPVTQADYYALAGIFTSTDLCAGVRNKMGGGGLAYYDPSMLVLLGEAGAPAAAPTPEELAKIESLKAEAEAARAEFQRIRGTPEGKAKGPDGRPTQRKFRVKAEQLEAELATLTDPVAGGKHAALGARDAKTVGDTQIRLRGEVEQIGATVPRGFLSVVQFPGQPTVNSAQSGRLELAQWLTSPQNPLASRVAVNRVWHHLFGRGIVSTVDNFGVTGDVPSHPELLDHLASRFVKDGWSVKRLVRTIVLSRAYRLSSDDAPANAAVDPAGALLWRHTPRRLTAEEIRDATLAASATLDRSRPAGSPAQELPFREQRNNGPEAARFAERARQSLYRSVYLPLLRGWTPTSLEVFDFAEQGMVTGSRDATTVPPQALYLLNDPFVRRQSQSLAERVLARTDLDDAGRIELAYRLALGRPPETEELGRARGYLGDYESESRAVLASAATAATAAPAPGETPVAVAAADAQEADKPAEAANPDEELFTDETARVDGPPAPSDPRVAAWASFCQALLGSAEFRYLK